MDILKNKYALGGIVIALVAGLGYYLWTSGGSSPLLSSTPSPVSQDLLDTLSKLNTITLNPAVFSDPAFVSLTDFGVTIPPEAAGRRNPFAPVGASSGTSTTTKSSR